MNDNETPVESIKTEILCKQCTAVLPVSEGSQLAVCEYCGTTNAVDKSQVVLHYAARATIQEADAESALKRWMGGNATVKNLDKKATIRSCERQLWPLWLVRADIQDKEKVFLKPAAAISVLDLTQITLPAADLEPFDPFYSDEALPATVPVNAVKSWLAADFGIQEGDIKETTLVHLPVYLFTYQFEGRPFTAVVEAAAGKVFADLFPSKQEVPYRAVGGLGCLLYFVAAFIPLGAFVTGGVVGLGGGILLYLIVAAILAVPIFAFAAFVSAKV